MFISVRELHSVTKHRPPPTMEGERVNIAVRDREKDAEMVVTLVAKRYCHGRYDCWLEWMLEI